MVFINMLGLPVKELLWLKTENYCAGGLNEIGKNLTVYEYGNDIVVVDCGMGFPDDDMYGIDVVIPE